MRAAVKSRDRHVLDALRVRDLAFERTIEELVSRTLEVKLSDLPAIGRYAELLTGEATDRVVDVREVRELVSLLVVRVAQLIEPSRRGELVQLVREIEGQLPGSAEIAP